MDSIFFTNFYWFSVVGHLLQVATRSQNATRSGGKGGSFSQPPPGAMALKLHAVSWLNVAPLALPGLPPTDQVIQVDVGGHPPIPFGPPQLSLSVFSVS